MDTESAAGGGRSRRCATPSRRRGARPRVDQAKPILSSPSLFDRSVMRCLMRESPPANGSSSQPAPALLDWSAAALSFPRVKQGLTLTGTFTLTRPPRERFRCTTSTRFQLPGLPVQRSSFNRRPFPSRVLGASQLSVFASLIVNRDRKAAGYPSALLPSRAAGVGLN